MWRIYDWERIFEVHILNRNQVFLRLDDWDPPVGEEEEVENDVEEEFPRLRLLRKAEEELPLEFVPREFHFPQGAHRQANNAAQTKIFQLYDDQDSLAFDKLDTKRLIY